MWVEIFFLPHLCFVLRLITLSDSLTLTALDLFHREVPEVKPHKSKQHSDRRRKCGADMPGQRAQCTNVPDMEPAARCLIDRQYPDTVF